MWYFVRMALINLLLFLMFKLSKSVQLTKTLKFFKKPFNQRAL